MGNTYGSMWLFIYLEVAYTILVPQLEEEEEDDKWNGMLYLPPSDRVFCYNVVQHFKKILPVSTDNYSFKVSFIKA